MIRQLKVALVWAQFAPYHVDRCEAVARALGDQAEVCAVEVATTSDTYMWEPSGAVTGCRKITLFGGRNIDQIGLWALVLRQIMALRTMNIVFLGLGYSHPSQFATAVLLRIAGVRVVMMNDSKFDDVPRRVLFELVKPFAMLPYSAALVAGDRHAAYLRFLCFGRRRVVQGYDTVGIDRVRLEGVGIAPPKGLDHAERPFVFVGRFVSKKGLPFLIAAYRRYRELAGCEAHRLVLVGSGPVEGEIRALVADGGLEDHVTFPGFLPATEVARTLASGLALVLPSVEEQWGLVVNEALALSLPVIVSENVGARDLLVRNLVNGFVVEQGSVEGLARAMLALSTSRAEWLRMAANSAVFAKHGDSARFADAVTSLLPNKAASNINLENHPVKLADDER